MWTRLSVRRPTLPAVDPTADEDDDDDLPDTKNAVFEMFSHSTASNHRKSEIANPHRARSSLDGVSRLSSSSPQRKLRSPLPTRSANVGIPVPKTSMDSSASPPSKSSALPKSQNVSPLGEKRSHNIHEESTSVHPPSPSLQRSAKEDVSCLEICWIILCAFSSRIYI